MYPHRSSSQINHPTWSNTNGNNKNIPDLTSSNNIRSNGTVLRSQSNGNARVSTTNDNNNNRNILSRNIQSLLQRHFKACFVTTKTISAGNKKVPIGTTGKVVLSRLHQGQYCCIFAAPYAGFEAIVNPELCLDFGKFDCTHNLIVCSVATIYCV